MLQMSSMRVDMTADGDGAVVLSPDVGRLQKKSLASLQRSLVMCHEMDVLGKHTVGRLDEGAKKLQLMEDQQAEMEKDLMETADNLDDLQTCCGGLCAVPWGKRRGPVENAPDAPPPLIVPPDPLIVQPGLSTGKFLPSIILIPEDHMELQLECDLELVEGCIDQLEQLSTDITAKLRIEAPMAESVTDKMDKNILRVGLARRKAKAALIKV